jgi:hypothetical protein
MAMKYHTIIFKKTIRLIVMALCLIICSCSSDGGSQTGDAVDSGATLQGNVLSVSNALFQITAANDLTVSIGGLAVNPDEQGYFQIENIPTGDQVVRFESIPAANLVSQAETGIDAEYLVLDIEESETIILPDVEIEGNKVSTAHTGTWTGTAGSDDPDSQGQIAFTMYIEANGNEISGTGVLGSPDNSIWNMIGTETGRNIDGKLKLVNSNSECATGGTFEGTFSGNTISATFVEVHTPEGIELCGEEETGTFFLEKE